MGVVDFANRLSVAITCCHAAGSFPVCKPREMLPPGSRAGLFQAHLPLRLFDSQLSGVVVRDRSCQSVAAGLRQVNQSRRGFCSPKRRTPRRQSAAGKANGRQMAVIGMQNRIHWVVCVCVGGRGRRCLHLSAPPPPVYSLTFAVSADDERELLP